MIANIKGLGGFGPSEALVKIACPGADPIKTLRKIEKSGRPDQSEAVVNIEISQRSGGTLEAFDPRKVRPGSRARARLETT